MHKDEIKGHIKKAEGEVQEFVGHAIGNPDQELEGQEKQVEGEFDKLKGKVKESLHKAID